MIIYGKCLKFFHRHTGRNIWLAPDYRDHLMGRASIGGMSIRPYVLLCGMWSHNYYIKCPSQIGQKCKYYFHKKTTMLTWSHTCVFFTNLFRCLTMKHQNHNIPGGIPSASRYFHQFHKIFGISVSKLQFDVKFSHILPIKSQNCTLSHANRPHFEHSFQTNIWHSLHIKIYSQWKQSKTKVTAHHTLCVRVKAIVYIIQNLLVLVLPFVGTFFLYFQMSTYMPIL